MQDKYTIKVDQETYTFTDSVYPERHYRHFLIKFASGSEAICIAESQEAAISQASSRDDGVESATELPLVIRGWGSDRLRATRPTKTLFRKPDSQVSISGGDDEFITIHGAGGQYLSIGKDFAEAIAKAIIELAE